MKDLRWFRLLLFCIGVYFAGTGAINILNVVRWTIAEIATGYTASRTGVADFVVSTVVYFIPCIFTLSIGVYLMKGGGKLTKWILRRVESNCMRCDTDLREVTSDRCPGCGLQIDRAKDDASASTNPS